MTEQNNYIKYPKDEAERLLKVADAFKRLVQNTDFKLVNEELTKVQPSRYTAMLGDPEIRKNPEKVATIVEDLKALGIYQDLMRDIMHRAQLARMSLMTPEEVQAEIEAEEAYLASME